MTVTHEDYLTLQAENAQLRQHITRLEQNKARLEQQLAGQTEICAFFKTLVDTIPHALVVTRPDGMIIYTNAAFHTLYGYKDTSGLSSTDIIAEEDRARFAAALQQPGDNGYWYGTFTQQRADGSTFVARVACALIVNRRDQLDGTTLIIHTTPDAPCPDPVSDDQQTLLQALLDYSPAFVYVKDVQGRYRLINHRFASMLLLTEEQIIGKTVEDLFPPELAAVTQSYDQQILTTGQPVSREQVIAIHNEPRTFLEIKFPIYDSQGVIRAIGGMNTDITERKRLEEQIRTMNARLEQQVAEQIAEARIFQTLVEHTPDAVSVTALDGTSIYANPANRAMFGYHDKTKGVARLTFSDSHDQALFERLRQRVLEQGRWQGMVVYRRADESLFPAQVSAVLLPDAAGWPQAIGVIIRDITETMQREEDLRTSEEQLRLVVQHMPVLLIAFQDAATGGLIVWNAECERVTGYRADEIIGNPRAMELLCPNAHYRAHIEQEMLHRGRNYRDWEWKISTRDGSEKIISWANISEHFPISGWASWAVGVDITERKQVEETLRASEAKYRTLFDMVPIGLYRTTPDGRVLDINLAAVEMLGYPDRAAMLADNATNFYVHPDDRKRWQIILEQEGIVRNFELQFRRQDGRVIWVLDNVRAIYDASGQITAYEGSLEDITERKAYQSQIEHLAFTDPLTGLSNRRRLYDVGEELLSTIHSTSTNVALLYLDLDRFKNFNDTLGHDAGDDLLRQVTERLQACIDEKILLARLGGDEFAALLSDATLEQTVALAQHMLEQIRRPFELYGQRVYLGGSIGIAFSPMAEIPFSTLLTHADIAMYRAKSSGSGIEIYDPLLTPILPDRIQLETDLRWSLATDTLQLYYQPIFDLTTNRIVGLEALLRWLHPTRGMLTPDIFLPLAEKNRPDACAG